MRTITVFVCVLFLCVGAAFGQIVPKGNIFVGYSYTRAKVFPGSGPVGAASNQTGNLNGWDGSLEGKVFPFIGIVADVSGHYGSREFTIGCEAIPTPPCVPQTANVHANLHTYLFGRRLRLGRPVYTFCSGPVWRGSYQRKCEQRQFLAF
jgi:hypothetical protein